MDTQQEMQLVHNSCNNQMDIKRIMQLIPHRYPILLLDKVCKIDNGKSIHAIKNVTINEEFFNGHFENYPVMPGVLIIEALAQASTLLCAAAMEENIFQKNVIYFASIKDAYFKKPVVPGDVLHLFATSVSCVRNTWKMQCEARVEDTIVTTATLLASLREKTYN